MTKLAIVMIVVIIVSMAVTVPVYLKMGRPAWVAFIPIYNGWVFMEEIFGNGAYTFVPLLFAIISGIAGAIPFIGGLIAVVCSLAMLFFSIYTSYRLARAFDRGWGTAIGLTLLPVVFYLIIGLGQSEYVGVEAFSLSDIRDGKLFDIYERRVTAK